jgi:hypothetical protein
MWVHLTGSFPQLLFIDSGRRLLGIETIMITIKQSTLILASAISAPCIVSAAATGQLSLEISRVAQLIGVVQYYQSLHNGESPDNLDELKNMIDLPRLLDVNPQLGGFGVRHCFVAGPLSIPGLGRIITIGANPDYDFGRSEKGRIVGYIDKNDTAGAYWLPEAEVQRILALNPQVKILPPMGPVPAPTIPLKTKESPPDEHHLQVLEHYSIQQKLTPSAENAPPTPAISSPPPATSSAPASPPASKPWRYFVAGLIVMLVGLWAFTKKRKPR